MLVKGFVVIIGFPCTTILLTNSASSLRILGTLNGFATTFSGMGRAVGPATVGAVFSWGVRHGYAVAPWWLLAAIALVGAVPPWFIVEGEGPTTSLGAGEDEEEEEEGERQGLLRRGRPAGGDSEDEEEEEEEIEDEDVPILEAVDEESDSGSDWEDSGEGMRRRAKKVNGVRR